MNDNLFFDHSQLKRCGVNVIIGKTVRIRYPELVEIGDNVIIDDFTYISTSLMLRSYVHITAGCKLIGGRNALVVMGTFSTLAPNVVLAAGSDDYITGLATPMVPMRFKGNAVVGRILIGEHCIVGANSTVLPNVTFGDGAVLGAQSLAKKDLDPWTIYAGVPARALKKRPLEEIKAFERQFLSSTKNA